MEKTIVELFLRNKSVYEIASIVGVDRSKVEDILRNNEEVSRLHKEIVDDRRKQNEY
jgi:plasmid maintenance system antidote protein VapI